MVPALMLAVLCSTVGVAFKRIQKDVKPLNFIEFSCAIFFGRKKNMAKAAKCLESGGVPMQGYLAGGNAAEAAEAAATNSPHPSGRGLSSWRASPKTQDDCRTTA